MAKIFTAEEIRKRQKLSGKVREVIDVIMRYIVMSADNGESDIYIKIDRDVVDAVTDKLKSNGFIVEYYPRYGSAFIGWKEYGGGEVNDKQTGESASGKANVTDKQTGNFSKQ